MFLLLKYLWVSIRPYKHYYAIMLLAPLATGFYYPATNYAAKLIIDTIVSSETFSYSDVTYAIIIFVCTGILIDLIWRLSEIAEWRSEPYVRRDLLLRAYNHVQYHSFSFFQNNLSGALTSKIKNILDGYNNLWEEMHQGLMVNISKIVVGLGSLFLVNCDIGLFLLAWSLAITIITYILSTRLLFLSKILSEEKHRVVGMIADRLANISSLLLFSARKREVNSLYQAISANVIPKEIKRYKYDFVIKMICTVFYLVMQLGILFTLISYKRQGLISVGDFVYIFSISAMIGNEIWGISNKLQDLLSKLGEAANSLELITAPHDSPDDEDAVDIKITTPSIHFQNLFFSYQQNMIFENLNLKIKAGEKIGLVGHSGAGKSSLISLLLKYFNPSDGQIIIGGKDITKIKQDSLRQNIAMIPQDITLFHDNVLENIRYSNPEATNQEVIEAARKAHIHEYIITLPQGYKTTVGERGLKLSVGQRQRIAIARAILKDAPILILDEATSSLDSKTEKYIQNSIEQLLNLKDKTVIAIAHRLSTIKDMDRIIVLDKGQIVEEGKHDDLMKMKNGIYQELWHYQKI